MAELLVSAWLASVLCVSHPSIPAACPPPALTAAGLPCPGVATGTAAALLQCVMPSCRMRVGMRVAWGRKDEAAGQAWACPMLHPGCMPRLHVHSQRPHQPERWPRRCQKSLQKARLLGLTKAQSHHSNSRCGLLSGKRSRSYSAYGSGALRI